MKRNGPRKGMSKTVFFLSWTIWHFVLMTVVGCGVNLMGKDYLSVNQEMTRLVRWFAFYGATVLSYWMFIALPLIYVIHYGVRKKLKPLFRVFWERWYLYLFIRLFFGMMLWILMLLIFNKVSPGSRGGYYLYMVLYYSTIVFIGLLVLEWILAIGFAILNYVCSLRNRPLIALEHMPEFWEGENQREDVKVSDFSLDKEQETFMLSDDDRKKRPLRAVIAWGLTTGFLLVMWYIVFYLPRAEQLVFSGEIIGALVALTMMATVQLFCLIGTLRRRKELYKVHVYSTGNGCAGEEEQDEK